MHCFFRIYLYLLPVCLFTFFITILTIFVLYHTKPCACCHKEPLTEIVPKQQCPEVLVATTPPCSRRRESDSPTSYGGNSLEHVELQEMSPFTEILVIARTKISKVWLGNFKLCVCLCYFKMMTLSLKDFYMIEC